MVLTQAISRAAGQLGCWWGLQSLTGLTELGNPLLDSLVWLLVGLNSFLAGSPRGREKDREILVGSYPGFSLMAVGLWTRH